MEYNIVETGKQLLKLDSACDKLKSTSFKISEIKELEAIKGVKCCGDESIEIKAQVETEANNLRNYINAVIEAEELSANELNELLKNVFTNTGLYKWDEAFNDEQLIQDLQEKRIVRVQLKNGEYLFLTKYNSVTGEITVLDSDDNINKYTFQDMRKVGGTYCAYINEKIEISETAKKVLEYMKELDKKFSEEKWTYGPTKEHQDLNGALNQEDHKVQCGSSISITLVSTDVICEDDLTHEYEDGQVKKLWNSPPKIRQCLEK